MKASATSSASLPDAAPGGARDAAPAFPGRPRLDRRASDPAPSSWPACRWRVRLLGSAGTVERADGAGVKLPSRAATALVARLAMWPERDHSREELVEILWPGVALDVGRNRLRQTLSVLRKLLEDEAAPGGAVILADRQALRAAPGAFACDVALFEIAARAHRPELARPLYRGELMPGHYDDWVVEERGRLEALRERLEAGGTGRSPAAPAPLPTPSLALPWTAPDRRAPAPEPAWSRPTSPLPHYLTPVFGIDLAGARLRDAIASHRLVTVMGPGGGGKTRLAVEVARAMGRPAAPWPQWQGWIAFVPLVACLTEAELLDRLGMALAIDPASAGADMRRAILRGLAGQPALLILDNLEQVIEPAGRVVADLLGELPLLRIVATSRRLLGVEGERLVMVEPLPLPEIAPPPGDGAAPEPAVRQLALSPAVALYVDRARERRADFHLGPRNAADVGELVRLLEGHPLAIELAAARIRSTPPSQWVGLLRAARARDPAAGRSDDTLALLARQGPRGGADPRHASMIDVIDWSWRLLDDDGRQLLGALTVFGGGCDAAAAHAVAGMGHSPARLQRTLDDLVSSSLVVAQEAADGGIRFTPYETVRDYAAARVGDVELAAWRARHRRWLCALAGDLHGDTGTPDLHRLREEMPNLLRGLTSALHDDAPAHAWDIVWSHRAAFADVTLPATGLGLLQAALERTVDPAQRLVGHAFLAAQCYEAGMHGEAGRQADAVLATIGEPAAIAHWDRRQTADPPDARAAFPDEPLGSWAVGWALRTLMRVGRALAEDDPWLVAARLDAAAAGPRGWLVQARLIGLQASFMMRNRADHRGAEPLRREALDLWKRTGNRLRINEGRVALAICLGFQHRVEEELPLLAEVEADALALGQARLVCFALSVRGYCLAELRRYEEALVAYHACLRHAAAAQAWRELFYGLWNLPRSCAHLRQPARAAGLMGFAETFYAERFGVLGPEDTREARRTRRLCAAQLGAAATDQAWEDGRRWSLARALATALPD